MQLIKTLFSNPTALIVLFSILVTGLLIIAYYARKASRITESKMNNVRDMNIGLIADSKLSAEFEERRMRALGNDSGVFGDWFFDDHENAISN